MRRNLHQTDRKSDKGNDRKKEYDGEKKRVVTEREFKGERDRETCR